MIEINITLPSNEKLPRVKGSSITAIYSIGSVSHAKLLKGYG